MSDTLSALDWRRPDTLVRTPGEPMMIFSDYSGQHKGATHEAYSFLVTDGRGIGEWQRRHAEFRETWLPDGREMSFKRLREPMRRRALMPFLRTAGHITGNMLTILVAREVGSFIEGGPPTAVETFPDCFSSGMRTHTVEKMLRIASFLALVVAGLRDEHQTALWLSDADEALETFERREQLARLASYLTHGVAGWRNPAEIRFGTTADSTMPQWCRDAASLPDIFAGAYCQLSNLLPTFRDVQSGLTVVSHSIPRDERARIFGDWLATGTKSLRHVLLRLERDEAGEVRGSAQAFAADRL